MSLPPSRTGDERYSHQARHVPAWVINRDVRSRGFPENCWPAALRNPPESERAKGVPNTAEAALVAGWMQPRGAKKKAAGSCDRRLRQLGKGVLPVCIIGT
jgi:hypothetical protein